MKTRVEMPAGLARASLEVLFPLALLAPLPLVWTDGVSWFALFLYECALLFLWRRARADRPVRLSDAVLNAAGLGYMLWLGFEVWALRHGLLRSVSHLLLFVALAKLASLKRRGEVRAALLVLFLLTLGAASSSTHVSSLLYLVAMGFVGFRVLGRLAVLADFDDAPPERVLASVPTRKMTAGALAAGVLLTFPLFYALPRLRQPFAVPRLRIEEAFSTALAADRVDLESFGAAKRSDRVILRMDVEPAAALPRVLRLREAVFTDYRRGVWTRRPAARTAEKPRAKRTAAPSPAERAGRVVVGRLTVDLNPSVNGFLFLPYGSHGLQVEEESPLALSDGVVQIAGSRRSIRYAVDVRGVDPRGPGASMIDPASVPDEIRAYARELTGDLSDPAQIFERVRSNFARNFLYTLDPPHGRGEPLVNFLLRSKAGHCEFFASGAAMILAARGIPARLVTGSYGGEVSVFSRALVVRAGNLHAWVEADLDGTGFAVLDPTPAVGIPPAQVRVSWSKLLSNLGKELEFFYDRRILGFDSLDQLRVLDAVRESLAGAAKSVADWRQFVHGRQAAVAATLAALLLLGAAAFVSLRLARRRATLSLPTKAYLALRRLLARRVGDISPAVPPLEVARLFAEAEPLAREDAQAVVSLYCASAFGGREPDPAAARSLKDRVRRLKKLA